MQTEPRSNVLVELINSFVEAVRGFWQKRAAVNELAACDAWEVTRIGQDLGISGADLRLLATRDQKSG
jgi:hypothetical protein